MDFNSFADEMKKYLSTLNISLNNEQIHQFYEYMNFLIDTNKVMNLTRITEPSEIVLKHFIDSLTVLKYVNNNEYLIDIGTGAGFPGVPLKIANSSLNVVLMDSLNKRISFINDVIRNNKLTNIVAVHARAEDLGQEAEYREKFDVAVSRAVAPLNILLEYMMPFIKVGGRCICMKGVLQEELTTSEKAIKTLGGEVEKIDLFKLPKSEDNRTILIIKKVKKTPAQYPRNAGIPGKKPL